MSTVWSLLAALMSGLVGACVGAWYQRRSMIQIEEEKTAQRRKAVGVLQQAELASLHRALKEYSRRVEAFCSKAASVGAANESDYVRWSENRKLYVFQSCIPDVGLFNPDTACQIAYVYNNLETFVQYENEFLRDLPSLINSSSLAGRTRNLGARVKGVMKHIERVMPMLAMQSQAIPFHPEQG